MTDNLRRYRAISDYLKQIYPNATGYQVHYLVVLAALIHGIVAAKHTHLSKIADKQVEDTQLESRIMRYTRWLDNEKLDYRVMFAPFAQAVLKGLAHQPLVLAMDGSTVGKQCMCLMLSVVYRGRALPIGWLVVSSPKGKGQLAEKYHLALLKQVQPLVPKGVQVVFVADGEYDGRRVLRRVSHYGWHYVCRSAKNRLLYLGDERTCFGNLAVERGTMVSIVDTVFSRYEYGPITAIAVWEQAYQEPLYLVTNLEVAEEAVWFYHKRFKIETFFSDQKSRGFNLDKSHLSQPTKLERLLVAAALAYLWLVYLGTLTLIEGWDKVIARPDRNDYSLFSLGLKLLDYFVNHLLPLPVAFQPLLDAEFDYCFELVKAKIPQDGNPTFQAV